MRTSRSGGAFALILIALGALIILHAMGFVFGHVFGHLMGYLFPLAMIFLGYVGIRSGSRFFGWLVAGVGVVILLGKLSGLIGLLIAIGLIVYGVKLLRNRAY